MASSLQRIMRNLSNLPGWRTKRKIIVFESDDWGSIRMPSLKAFQVLKEAGVDVRGRDAERYNLNDSIASSTDLEMLFEVLSTSKDRSGHNAIFTPVSIVANPDFQKIIDSNFQNYFYEPFIETLKRYPGCERSFDLWKEGIEKNIFVPQMHGREHLNVAAWMKALQKGDRQTRMAFDQGLWGFVPDQHNFPGVDFQAAFLLGDPSELEQHKTIIEEGLNLFEKLFGYRPEYFVPPNGPFNNDLNKTLVKNGIKYRSASKIQNEPLGNCETKKVIHWLGQRDRSGLRYITRNCFFEPSQPGKDWVDGCLNDIKIAFRWNKPAIISSHRVNYIGSLNPSNRDNGLQQLSKLLKRIFKSWPDAEFMTTARLGATMFQGK